MVNPIKKIKQSLGDLVTKYPFVTAAATLYVSATIAVNSLVYTTSAGMESIERACGTTPYKTTASLKEKGIMRGPHSRIPYGIFVDSEDKELTLMDSPVVTEGKFFPGTLRKMEPGKNYEVEIFGSPKFVQRIVDAKPTSE